MIACHIKRNFWKSKKRKTRITQKVTMYAGQSQRPLRSQKRPEPLIICYQYFLGYFALPKRHFIKMLESHTEIRKENLKTSFMTISKAFDNVGQTLIKWKTKNPYDPPLMDRYHFSNLSIRWERRKCNIFFSMKLSDGRITGSVKRMIKRCHQVQRHFIA